MSTSTPAAYIEEKKMYTLAFITWLIQSAWIERCVKRARM